MKKIVRKIYNCTTAPALSVVIVLALVNIVLFKSMLNARIVPLSTALRFGQSNPAGTDESLTDQSAVSLALMDMLNAAEKKEFSPANGWQTVVMRVTAYCPCRKCCGRFADGRTACNHRIRPGDVFVAADKRYPFGTEVVIPGYNGNRPVKVLDRGKAIRGNRLDIFFASHWVAKKWGTKYLLVRVRVPQ